MIHTSPAPAPAAETRPRGRPLSVTIVGRVFVVVGAVSFVAGLLPLLGLGAADDISKFRQQPGMEYAVMLLIRFAALVGGIFLLRGRAWARWLLVGWMAFHLVLSLWHSLSEVLMHAAIFGALGYLLFRHDAGAYFGQANR